MFARVLGWLRKTGDPVVEQSAPSEAPSSASQVRELRAQIADADDVLREVVAGQLELQPGDRDMVLFDLVMDLRMALGLPPAGLPVPPLRRSAPVIPGRSS